MGDEVILYEHDCPRCRVLKAKLEQKNIRYKDITDIELMKAKGFEEAPQLEINGVVMNFSEAVKWIGEQ